MDLGEVTINALAGLLKPQHDESDDDDQVKYYCPCIALRVIWYRELLMKLMLPCRWFKKYHGWCQTHPNPLVAPICIYFFASSGVPMDYGVLCSSATVPALPLAGALFYNSLYGLQNKLTSIVAFVIFSVDSVEGIIIQGTNHDSVLIWYCHYIYNW